MERPDDAVKRANDQCEPRGAVWFSWALMHSLIGDARFNRRGMASFEIPS